MPEGTCHVKWLIGVERPVGTEINPSFCQRAILYLIEQPKQNIPSND